MNSKERYLAHIFRAEQNVWARLKINVTVLCTLKFEELEAQTAAKARKERLCKGLGRVRKYFAGAPGRGWASPKILNIPGAGECTARVRYLRPDDIAAGSIGVMCSLTRV